MRQTVHTDAGITEEYLKMPACNDVSATQVDVDTFYPQVDVTGFEGDEFEEFWTRLAKRNAHAFQPGSAPAGNTESPAAAAASASVAGPATASDDAGEEVDPETAARELEKACGRVRELMNTRIVDREIYRRILAYCTPMADFAAVEEAIQEFPEFGSSSQSPYRYIKTLIEEGGLFQWDLDEAGQIIDPARYEGLSTDEVDDLIFSYGLETTEAGRIVAAEREPRKRLRDLLSLFPDRSDIFKELLGFIKDNHCKYDEIEKLFKGRDFSGIKTASIDPHIQIQPSVFLDNMENAGGIVWKDCGWQLTREGEAFLEELITRNHVA